MARVFHRQGADHGNHGAFGGAIVFVACRAHDGGEAGGGHHGAATAARHHVFGGRAERVEHGVQVDFHHLVPLVVGHVGEAAAVAAADAGIAERGHGVGEGAVHGRAVADVDFLHQHAPSGGFQAGAGRLVLGLVLAPDGHVGAGLGDRLGHGEADAAIAAGDQRHLAGEIERLERHA